MKKNVSLRKMVDLNRKPSYYLQKETLLIFLYRATSQRSIAGATVLTAPRATSAARQGRLPDHLHGHTPDRQQDLGPGRAQSPCHAHGQGNCCYRF